jgi:hypothetical protein
MTTHILFVAGILLLPLIGACTWRMPAVGRMDLAGRIAVAGAAGALITALVMASLSMLHIPWSRTVLFIILGAVAFLSVRMARAVPGMLQPASTAWKADLTLIAVFVLLTCYGLLTARESVGDLHFFWGPKAIRFYHAGGIDVGVLADKFHTNRDYPPLLPLIFAFCQTVARQFSWWGALLSTAFFLAGSIAIVRTSSGDSIGALLMAATLSWTLAVGFAGGGADPCLLFFETLTLAALTFFDGERGRDVLAAVGLAGAALTKIEGATFVVAIVIAVVVVQRSVKRAVLIAAPAVALVAAWVVFLIANDLIFGYGGATMGLKFEVLPRVVSMVTRAGMYNLYGFPWIAPLLLVILTRSRRAAFPLVVTLLTLGATLFFYIHVDDPAWWIAASAPRVLLTPLTALLIAACCSGMRPQTRG